MSGVQIGYMERREFERLMASVKISYQVVEKADLVNALRNAAYRSSTAADLPDLARRSTVFHAVTRDLTPTGMCIVTREAISSGTAVTIQLTLQSTPTPVTLLAEVDDVQKSDGLKGASWHATLKILAINREDVVRIEKHLLVEKLRQTHDEKRPAPVRKK
jgi:hypothetical protein